MVIRTAGLQSAVQLELLSVISPFMLAIVEYRGTPVHPRSPTTLVVIDITITKSTVLLYVIIYTKFLIK